MAASAAIMNCTSGALQFWEANVPAIQRLLLQTAYLLVACVFSGTAVYSQVADANLMGVVVDPDEAVVPNASVDLLNEATGIRAHTTTDKTGSYRFLNVYQDLIP
jgi:hypothetical protein